MGSTRAGDWACPSCNATVFASKRECYLCKTSKPDGEICKTSKPDGEMPGEAAPPLSKPVEQMKMAELRRALEARGLNPAGLRPALVARLQQAVRVSGQRPEASAAPPSAAPPPAAALAPADLPWICQHCSAGHPSRNALFRHLTKSCDPTAAAGPPTERVALALAYQGTGYHGANRNGEEDEEVRPTVAGAVLGPNPHPHPNPNPSPSPNSNPNPSPSPDSSPEQVRPRAASASACAVACAALDVISELAERQAAELGLGLGFGLCEF